MENFNRDLEPLILQQHTKSEKYKYLKLRTYWMYLRADRTQQKIGSVNSKLGEQKISKLKQDKKKK